MIFGIKICGNGCLLIGSVVLTRYQRATDRRTDGRTDGQTDRRTELLLLTYLLTYLLISLSRCALVTRNKSDDDRIIANAPEAIIINSQVITDIRVELDDRRAAFGDSRSN